MTKEHGSATIPAQFQRLEGVVASVFVYLYVPETRGKTMEDVAQELGAYADHPLLCTSCVPLPSAQAVGDNRSD